MSKILGKELLPKIMDFINSEKLITVVATVDKNDNPNTTPIGFVKATDSKTLRLAFLKIHDSLQNIKENGRMCVSILGEDNIAISIKGRGTIIRDVEDYSIVEMKIDEIKSDRSPHLKVVKGIAWKVLSEKDLVHEKKLFNELNK